MCNLIAIAGADPGILKGGSGRNFFKKGGGGRGGGQPLTQEQFVLQINKIFSKRGGGEVRTPWTPPPPPPSLLDLPLNCPKLSGTGRAVCNTICILQVNWLTKAFGSG